MLLRRFLITLLVPIVLLGGGMLGYHLIEGWSLFDSLYMTVITLTTVGYGEIPQPLSQTGRFFTMILLLGGVFTLAYALTEGLRTIVSGEIEASLGRQRVEHELAEIKGHTIVCGYGRMGRLVCKEFSTQKVPFVIIDRDADLMAAFKMPHGIALVGDATSDEVLTHAGVKRARALVTVAASDADNLYITMSARLLNDKIYIVARAEQEHAEQKLIRAGANRVISPYAIGGSRVAMAVLRPAVVDFIELATRTEHLDLQIEETRIAASSRLAGVTIKDSDIRKELGVIIVAVKKGTGHMIYNPAPEVLLQPGDVLITVGNRAQLDQLDRLAGALRPGK